MALVVALGGLWFSGYMTAEAVGPDPDGVIVALDMDPTDGAGNSCAQNQACSSTDCLPEGAGYDCTLGPITRCISVSAGDPVDFDVILDDLEVDSHLGHGYKIDGWPASGTDGTPPQMTGHIFTGAPAMTTSRSGHSVFPSSEAIPDGDLPYSVTIADTGTAEYEPPWTKGVLGRYTLDTTGAAPGIYGLDLYDVVVGRDTLADPLYPGYTLGGLGLPLQAIIDKDYNDSGGYYGLLAVGVACPDTADLEKIDLVPTGISTSSGSPSSALLATPLWFTLTDQIDNNGPQDNVDSKITTSVLVPTGLKISYEAKGTEVISVNGSLLNCTAPGGTPVDCDTSCSAGVCPLDTHIYVYAGNTLTVEEQKVLVKDNPTANQIVQDWDVLCMASGPVSATFNNTIAAKFPIYDGNSGNDTDSVTVYVDCMSAATADIVITEKEIIDGIPDPKSEGLADPLPYPTLYTGDTIDVTLFTELTNTGPFDLANADLTKVVQRVYIGMGGAETGTDCLNATDDDYDGFVNDGCTYIGGTGAGTDIPEFLTDCENATDDDADTLVNEGCPAATTAGDCTAVDMTATSQFALAEGVPVPHNEVFEIQCGQGGITKDNDADGKYDEDTLGGPGVDNDGDGLIDEDDCDTVDDDADTMVDEDDPFGDGDCDGTIDEDSPFYVTVFVFVNFVEPKPGILDPDLELTGCDPANPLTWSYCGDNYRTTMMKLMVIRPFSPTFAITIDDTNPGVQANPTADACLAGLPCKRMEVITIGSSPPSFPGDEPFPEAMATVLGTAVGEWTHTDGVTIPIPEKVGNFDFTIHTDFGFAATCELPFSGVDVPLYNACLPPTTDDAEDTGGDTGGADSCFDTVDNTGGDGIDYLDADDCNMVHQITGYQYVPNDTCAVNYYDPTGGAALLIGPYNGPGVAEISWSSRLDHTVNAVINARPTAVLWARFVAYVEPTAGNYVPINMLVFDLSGGAGLGPWMSATVLADPDAAPLDSLIDFCTPFSSNVMILGEGETSSVPILRCNATDPYGTAFATDRYFAAAFTRDTGEEDMLLDTAKCVAENDVYCGDDKDEAPFVGIKLLEQEAVDVFVTNGIVPSDIAVEVSVMSPLACAAEWVDPGFGTVNPPITIGAMQFSKIEFLASELSPGGLMGGDEMRTANLEYEVYCEEGSHQLQIITNVASYPTLPDPDPLNNQCQNHPVVTADDPDVDLDTVVNWLDNCPRDENADQADNDGDGMGDACDPDDDNDGYLDGADACPFTPEDDDDVDDDGCPETDLSIFVNKDHEIDVNVSETTRFTVTTTAQNEEAASGYGLYAPDGVRFIELLKSDVSNPDDKCEAHWVCLPGDNCVEDIILEDWDNDPETPDVPVLYSQLEVVISPLPIANSVDKVRDYEIHCNARSDHEIFLEEAVVPTHPVMDPDVQNNVEKQYIPIEAWDNADLKFLSADFHTAPVEMEVGVPATFMLKKVMHNNGPSDALGGTLWGDFIDFPEDCEVTGFEWTHWNDLVVSTQMVHWEEFEIVCSQPCDHTFTLENVVSTNEEHLRDPDLSNNTVVASVTVPVIGETAVSVDTTVNADLSMNVSEDELFTVDTEITNAGFAVEPEVDQEMQPTGENADDCRMSFHVSAPFLASIVDGGQGLTITKDGEVVDPPTPAGWESSDWVYGEYGGSIDLHYQVELDAQETLILVEDWDKHCLAPCFHDFEMTTDVSRNAAKDPHVLFDPASDSDPFTEEVWGEADLKICDWYILDADEQIDLDSWMVMAVPETEARDLHEKEVLHNNGPYGPASALESLYAAPSDGCTVTYECKGGEVITLNEAVVEEDCAPGTVWGTAFPNVLDIHFPVEDIPVSVNLWQSNLWAVSIEDCAYECTVDFTKVLDGTGDHIDDPALQNNTEEIDVTVCADTDEDGVPDQCMDEQDNCMLVANPDQTDSDGDGVGDACEVDRGAEVKYCLKFGPAPVNISDTQGKYLWTICEIGNTSSMDEVVTISLDVAGVPAGCDMLQQLILPGQDTFVLEGPQGIDNDLDGLTDEDPIDGIDNDSDTSIDEDPPEGEQKFVLFRNRLECHEDGSEGIYPLAISACVDPAAANVNHDGDQESGEDGCVEDSQVPGEVCNVDDDGDSLVDEDPPNDDPPADCHEQIKNMIIHQP